VPFAPVFFAVTSAIFDARRISIVADRLARTQRGAVVAFEQGREMALIGPIVRNELFFFVFVFGAGDAADLARMAIGFARKISEGSCGGCGTAAAGVAETGGARRWMMASTIGVPHPLFLVLTGGFYLYAGRIRRRRVFAGRLPRWE